MHRIYNRVFDSKFLRVVWGQINQNRSLAYSITILGLIESTIGKYSKYGNKDNHRLESEV